MGYCNTEFITSVKKYIHTKWCYYLDLSPLDIFKITHFGDEVKHGGFMTYIETALLQLKTAQQIFSIEGEI